MKPRLVRLAVWAGALLALAATFAAYLNPHIVVDLANRVRLETDASVVKDGFRIDAVEYMNAVLRCPAPPRQPARLPEC